MMNSRVYKLVELLIFFVSIPLVFLIDFSIAIKMAIGVLGFIYIVYVLLRVEKLKFKLSQSLDWTKFSRTLFFRFLIIASATVVYQYIMDPTKLFYVLLNKPKLWIAILFVYSFFSVYPQELIYRTFFFQRYGPLFHRPSIFILANALLFSLGHIFFRNSLVLIITFLGGVLFAMTYYKTRSTVLVSIEHAIYGCWLFTIGMGSMLGFPS